MLLMNQTQFNRARNYIMQHGRPLERALFIYHFEGGSSETVIQVLADHQNEDGGFERMGEGDESCSSPIGTCAAFRILGDLRIPADNVLVRRGVSYFLNSYDDDLNYWFPDLQRKNPPDDQFDYLWGNPSAEIVGYLHEYAEIVPADFLDKVTSKSMDNLRQSPRPLEMFSELCFLMLADRISTPYASEIIDELRSEIRTVASLDPADWDGYFAKPIWYGSNPSSQLYDMIEHEVQLNLGFLLNERYIWLKGWPTVI